MGKLNQFEMLDATRSMAGFGSRFEPEEASKLNEMSGHDDGYFDLAENDAYIPEFLEEYDGMHETRVGSGVFEGMIFMSNSRTKKECFRRKLFGLPGSYASIVKHVKPGTKLFLFEYERREMHGIFEATSSGAMNIEPNAFKGSGRQFPAQVRFRRVWDCYPLSENDFKKAISKNYHTRKEFYFALSGDQVAKLMSLFDQQKIEFQVSVRVDCDEDSHDLSRTDIRHEKAGFSREISRKMSKSDCYAGDTMYGHSDGQQERACTRESHFKDAQCTGNVYARQTMHDISNAGQILPSTGGLVFEGPSNYNFHAGQERACTRESHFKDVLCTGNVYAGQTMHGISNAGHILPSTGGLVFKDPCNHNFHAGQERACIRESHFKDVLYTGNVYAGQTMHDISNAGQILPSTGGLVFEDPCNYNFHAGQTISDILDADQSLGSHSVQLTNSDNFDRLNSEHQSYYVNVNEEIYDNSYRDNLYYNGTRLSHSSPSLDSLPVILDDFEDDYCLPKKSVFSRLKRVPEIGVLHEKEHTVFRQTYKTSFPQQKQKRKFVSFAIAEIESPGKQVKIMLDAENTDEPTEKEGIVINFKRRSQITKYGKETTLQVEGETNTSDGQQNSNKHKKRKLIRPQFDTVKVNENTMDAIRSCSKECPNKLVLPRTAILDDKKGGCDSRQESGKVLANVTEHSDCCNVQLMEVKNKGLVNLDGSESYRKDCPCQLARSSSEILATQNAKCDCGQENGKASSNKRECGVNVTEHSDCCNVQPMEVKNKGLANLDGSEIYRIECPCQLVHPISEILVTQNVKCDCGQENGNASSNEIECADSCNFQVMGEIENQDITKIDLNKVTK